MADGERIGAAYVEITADTKAVEAALEGVKLAIMSTDDRLEKLRDEFSAGGMSADKYYGEVNKLNAKLQELRGREEGLLAQQRALNQAMSDMTTATVRVDAGMGGISGSLNKVGDGAGKAGQRLLQFARVADDSQYLFQNGMGLRPIINNMMEIMPAAGLAMLAIDMLIRHWDKIAALFGGDTAEMFSTEIDKISAKIKELSSKPVKTEIDITELERYQRELEKATKAKQFFDSLQGKQSKAERASGAAIEEAIVETPGGQEAIDRFKAQRIQRSIEASPDVKAARDEVAAHEANLAEAMKQHAGPDVLQAFNDAIEAAKQKLEDLKGRVHQNAASEAEKAVSEAMTGTGQDQARAQRELMADLFKQGGGLSRAQREEFKRRTGGVEYVNPQNAATRLAQEIEDNSARMHEELDQGDFEEDRREEADKRAKAARKKREHEAKKKKTEEEREDDQAYAIMKQESDAADAKIKKRNKDAERKAKSEREQDVRQQAQAMNAVFGPDIARDLARAPGSKERADALMRARVAADLKRAGLARPGTEEDVAKEMVADARHKADQLGAAVGRFGVQALQRAGRSRFAPKPKRTGRHAAAARPRAGATHQASASGSKAERLLEQIAAAATKQAAQGEDAARALDTLASI